MTKCTCDKHPPMPRWAKIALIAFVGVGFSAQIPFLIADAKYGSVALLVLMFVAFQHHVRMQ